MGESRQPPSGVPEERRTEAIRTLLSGRLRRSLESQDRSIRWLQRELEERGAENSSYGAVHSYVTGKKMPPFGFLLATADVLGLRLHWLLLGKGEPTPEQQQAREEPEEEIITRLNNRYPKFGQLPEQAQGLFVDVLIDYVLTASDAGDIASEDEFPDILEEFAGDLLWLVLLPISGGKGGSNWGFRKFPGDMTERELSQYTVAMLHALQCGFADKGEGDAVDDAAGSRLRRMRHAFDNLG